MVAQMHHNGRLTPTLMLRALCTGDVAFFEVYRPRFLGHRIEPYATLANG